MTVTTTARPTPASNEEAPTSEVVAVETPEERDDVMPRPSSAAAGPKLPRIVRPHQLPRAVRPADIPTPDHHHLPGWVRRVHGQVRPILADIAGNLEDDARARFDADVAGVIAAISSGRFSVAWQYPRLISDGMTLVERHRSEIEEQSRRRRSLDNARRKASDALRDQGTHLATDASARLQRSLRSATDVDAVRAVEREVEQATTVARSVEERRREREIDKTRQRIRRVAPRGAEPSAPAEAWQDTLRRIADQYSE